MLRSTRKKTNNEPSRRRDAARSAAPPSSEKSRDFVRNRTLVGSASSRVVSTAESNGQLQSSRVKAHHMVSQRRKLGILLSALSIASLLLAGLVSQFTAEVNVEISGVSYSETTKTYEKIIDTYYRQRPIERLRFMQDEDTFTRFIQSKAPEIADASLNGSAGFATSNVTLVARKPVSSWDVDGVRTYVDATGVSFAKNYYERPGVKIIDNSGVPAGNDTIVASKRFLSFIGLIVGLTDAQGYDVTKIVIPEGTTRQVELSLKGIAYPIKCSIDRTAGEQAEDIDVAIRHMKKKNISPEYIDVRVSGKAFYR